MAEITGLNNMSTQEEMDLNSPFLYRSARQYGVVLPEYHFPQGSDLEIASNRLSALAHNREGSVSLIDCGAGPGRVWEYIENDFDSIIAIEPSQGMWRNPAPEHVTYVESGAFEYLDANPSQNQVISFLWSVNYPLLSFFEKYDPEAKKVIQFDWNQGAENCRSTVQSILQKNINSDLFIMVFDDDSPEQKFVTSIWEAEAAFPFNDRSFTRKLLFSEMEKFAKANGLDFDIEHHTGAAHYGPEPIAISKLLNFHLRGHFNEDQTAVMQATSFLNSYSDGNKIIVPAGMYLATLKGL